MKPIINQSRNILILCLCLVALAGLHCRRRNDRASAHESKITLLCMYDTEQSVFRDGQGTHFLMFIPLVDWDEEGQPQPRLLERWEHSNDYTEWTFYLRKDVKWHDGKPVTAHDVKFTLELFTDPNPDEPEPNRISDLRTALTNPANLVFHRPFLFATSPSYEGGEKRRRRKTRRPDITNFEKVGHLPKPL